MIKSKAIACHNMCKLYLNSSPVMYRISLSSSKTEDFVKGKSFSWKYRGG